MKYETTKTKINKRSFVTLLIGLASIVAVCALVYYVPKVISDVFFDKPKLEVKAQADDLLDGELETLPKVTVPAKPDPLGNFNCTDANKDDPECKPKEGTKPEMIQPVSVDPNAIAQAVINAMPKPAPPDDAFVSSILKKAKKETERATQAEKKAEALNIKLAELTKAEKKYLSNVAQLKEQLRKKANLKALDNCDKPEQKQAMQSPVPSSPGRCAGFKGYVETAEGACYSKEKDDLCFLKEVVTVGRTKTGKKLTTYTGKFKCV